MFLLFLFLIGTESIICCYYRQHYHDAFCGNTTYEKAIGCIITSALISGNPKILCQENGCMPSEINQGYWLEGFENNCDYCSGGELHYRNSQRT